MPADKTVVSFSFVGLGKSYWVRFLVFLFLVFNIFLSATSSGPGINDLFLIAAIFRIHPPATVPDRFWLSVIVNLTGLSPGILCQTDDKLQQRLTETTETDTRKGYSVITYTYNILYLL